jgi:hypothetical protein
MISICSTGHVHNVSVIVLYALGTDLLQFNGKLKLYQLDMRWLGRETWPASKATGAVTAAAR